MPLASPDRGESPLARAIRAGRVEFPYKRRFLPPVAEYMGRLANAADHVAVEVQTGEPARWAAVALNGRGQHQRDLVPWGFEPPSEFDRDAARRRDAPYPEFALVSLIVDEAAYDDIDVLPDLFTEEARMQARVLREPAPVEVWRSDPQSVIDKAPRDCVGALEALELTAPGGVEPGPAAAHCLREGVYGAAREATQFKVSLGAAVYLYFARLLGRRPEDLRVLDPSAGWGDRALGAAAAGVGEYVGADPNPRLREGHAAIAAAVLAEAERAAAAHRADCAEDPCPHGFAAPALARRCTRPKSYDELEADGEVALHSDGGIFALSCPLGKRVGETVPVGPTRVRVVPKPFEDVAEQELGNADGAPGFDLVFTSPPFFDFETYNAEDAGQSLARAGARSKGAPDFARWLSWFVAFCAKGYSLLRPGGFLALYFVDHRPRSASAAKGRAARGNGGPPRSRGRQPEKPTDAVRRAIAAAGGQFVGVIAARRGAKRPIPIWVFRKPSTSASPPTSASPDSAPPDSAPPGSNPPLRFEDHVVEDHDVITGIRVAVAREDLATAAFGGGGTKVRIMVPHMRRSASAEFIYVSPPTGFAQLALALSAAAVGKRAVVFVRDGPENEGSPRSKLAPATRAARDAGAKIVRPRGQRRLRDLREAAAEYAAAENAAGRPTEVMPFGLQSEELIAGLADELRDALARSDRPGYAPRRVWLAVGSGVILRALHRVWPGARYMCVQVGKDIYPDVLEGIDHEVLKAPEHFMAAAAGPAPPFPSVATYDAKVWRFVVEAARTDPDNLGAAQVSTDNLGAAQVSAGAFGEDAQGYPSDLVWNVAADQ